MLVCETLGSAAESKVAACDKKECSACRLSWRLPPTNGRAPEGSESRDLAGRTIPPLFPLSLSLPGHHEARWGTALARGPVAKSHGLRARTEAATANGRSRIMNRDPASGAGFEAFSGGLVGTLRRRR